MNPLYVGIDLSKDQLDIAVWDGQTATSLGGVDNTPEGFQTLASLLADQSQTGAPCLVIEPTGSYHLALVAFIHQQPAWTVAIPNPKRVKDWAAGMGYRAKTDAVDALKLAHYGAACQPDIQPPIPEELQKLDHLLKRQQDLKHLLQQERNRLHALKVRPDYQPDAKASVTRTIDFLELELNTLKQAIAHFFKQHPHLHQQLKLLRTLPGIGPVNAPYILLLLARWDCLTDGQGTAKQLTAFVGLDPKPHSSGSSVFKPASISKMGDSYLRALLYMGALGGLKGDNPLKAFYKALVQRGKAKRLALVAAARKILVWAWACFSKNKPFDPKIANPNCT